jgi:hypothetical protein
MSATATRLVRFAVSLAILTTLGWMLTVRAASPARRGMPLPTDWSHHHLFFSQPGTPEAAARVQGDVRFQQQWMRRNQPLELKRATVSPQLSTSPQVAEALGPRVPRRRAMQTRVMGRDWAQDVGTVIGGPPVPNLGLAGVYPAKFSIDGTAANCGSATPPDFVVFPTGFTGSGSQANIVAYDNIYSGCSGTVPSVYWAYNITDASLGSVQILTSPTLSLDGSQVAFVADNPTAHASWLVILRWAASTTQSAGAPGLVNSVSNGTYSGCTAPCMTTIELRTGMHTTTEDTTSSVFYDYANDSAWVGDNQGWLHKFSGVFKGTPTEVTTNFPVQVRGEAFILSSPVYDHGSQHVFVGDSDGFLSRVDGTLGTVVSSGQLDFGTGLVAGPVVDSTSGLVYVSASSDGTASCAADACAAVYQLATSFAGGSTGTEVTVGKSTVLGSTPNPMYNGEFDNAYLTSVNATGNFYVCGNTGAKPILYQVPITSGVPSNGVEVATLGTNASTAACSPVTDVPVPSAAEGSPATERVFVSVQDNSSASTCAGGGCVQSLIDTPWQASTVFPVGQEILVTSPSDTTVRYINIVISNPTTGASGTTEPNWPDTNGVERTDGAITWLNQGNPNLSAASWTPSTSYGSNARIIDSNGNYEIQTIPGGGPSGVGPPPWATSPGALTPDGAVLVWINAGPPPSSAIAAAGGTGAIIIDNTITTGMTSGTSQVYFSTLNNQTCGTSGSGSCAVQASQAALQ